MPGAHSDSSPQPNTVRRYTDRARGGSAELLKAGPDIQTDEELPGHNDVSTTMVYAHVPNRGPAGVRSPVNGLCGNVRRLLCRSA